MGQRAWDSYPAFASQEFLQRLLRANGSVLSFVRLSPNRYTVERASGVTLELYLTPVYILGEADYVELRLSHPDVNTIVLASNWNSATEAVYDHAHADGVGLHDMTALMGALNITDDERRVRHGAPERDDDSVGRGRA